MKLVWLDLETTGLDPATCEILEVAAVVTDINRPFEATFDAEARRLGRPLKPNCFHAIFKHVLDQEKVTPFVWELHSGTGLKDRCAKSVVTVADVEPKLITLVGEFDLDARGKPEPHTLAGASVNFDLAFLRVHMPAFAAKFSHRVYDTSAVKLFCRSLGMTTPLKREAHRAIADVNESIEHAKACAAWLAQRASAPPTP